MQYWISQLCFVHVLSKFWLDNIPPAQTDILHSFKILIIKFCKNSAQNVSSEYFAVESTQYILFLWSMLFLGIKLLGNQIQHIFQTIDFVDYVNIVYPFELESYCWKCSLIFWLISSQQMGRSLRVTDLAGVDCCSVISVHTSWNWLVDCLDVVSVDKLWRLQILSLSAFKELRGTRLDQRSRITKDTLQFSWTLITTIDYKHKSC